MIRRFCDQCGGENAEGLNERLTVQAGRFTLEVMVACDGTWNTGDLCHACVRALIAFAPKYPDTRFAVLCALDTRKCGDVTVGETRLPAWDVMNLIRVHGVDEARLMWPQLSDQELRVLARLVVDWTTVTTGTGNDEEDSGS